MSEELKALSRSDILNAKDSRVEECPVPEWGGKVFVKALKGFERDQYEESILTLRDDGQYVPTLENARAKLVVLAVVDEKGEQLFKEQDVFDLGQKSAAALQRVWTMARDLAGLSEDALKKLVEKSKATPNKGSTTDSH